MRRIVTDQVFTAFLDCAHKGVMYRNRRHGRKSEYQEHEESFDKTYREVALRRLLSQHGAVRQVPRLAPVRSHGSGYGRRCGPSGGG